MAGKCWFARLADQINRLFRPESPEIRNAGIYREADQALLSEIGAEGRRMS